MVTLFYANIMSLEFNELKDFLDSKVEKYNNVSFIENDPISIPHKFNEKRDIEIAAFLSATIAWGQRTTIINNADKLMQYMDYEPFEFIMQANKNDLKVFKKFVHRTFNGEDCLFFLRSLKNIYANWGGLEDVFTKNYKQTNSIKSAIINFREIFLELQHQVRTEKHVANPAKGSSAKRINMFLRWMVRDDNKGVDFGIWKNIHQKSLFCPLDVHSGRIARGLQLLQRKQNDWAAVAELTHQLRLLDPLDPVKYDFALFGLGIDEKLC